ncbi:MAG: flagellar biosynthesis anti-sigma factor FlgM [Bacteriovoracaceae bacterium]|jgi:negative regulator of flagellin synthesis FlgM|nr:flagellar biosynthesis anti-sigma factor FlgM [Bacteriovoracaceae bacterium]
MNNIDTSSRSSFFPRSRAEGTSSQRAKALTKSLARNDAERIKALEQTKDDARVSIPEGIKDFARIKKAVDAVPDRDNSAKVARLKQQIENGTYKVNYEALADKILASEF